MRLTPKRPRRVLPAVAIGLFATILLSAAPATALADPPGGTGTTVDLEEFTVGADGQVIRTTGTARVDTDRTATGTARKPEPVAGSPAVKVSPRFATQFAPDLTRADPRVQVLVTFVEDLSIPRFPGAVDTQPSTA